MLLVAEHWAGIEEVLGLHLSVLEVCALLFLIHTAWIARTLCTVRYRVSVGWYDTEWNRLYEEGEISQGEDKTDQTCAVQHNAASDNRGEV